MAQHMTYSEKFDSNYLNLCKVPLSEHSLYLNAQELRLKGPSDSSYQAFAKEFQDLKKSKRNSRGEESKYKLGLVLIILWTAFKKKQTLEEYFREERCKLDDS